MVCRCALHKYPPMFLWDNAFHPLPHVSQLGWIGPELSLMSFGSVGNVIRFKDTDPNHSLVTVDARSVRKPTAFDVMGFNTT